MSWDGKGRRAEDQGRESLRDIVISTRQDVRNHIDNFEKHDVENARIFNDHATRLRSVEDDRIRIYTGAGIVAFIVGFIMRIWK